MLIENDAERLEAVSEYAAGLKKALKKADDKIEQLRQERANLRLKIFRMENPAMAKRLDARPELARVLGLV